MCEQPAPTPKIGAIPRSARADERAKRRIDTLVTYLEMTAPPAALPPAPPRPGLEVRRARSPTVSFYRYLYGTIGADWTWVVRRLLSDQELCRILEDPAVEVNVLWLDGVPAGLAELDRRQPPDIELAYFGLLPEFIGRGFGRWFLDWAIRHAWRAGPCRLWVHTCDLDHPRALGVYQKCGFRAYDQRIEQLRLPDGMTPPEQPRAGTGSACGSS
jgi:GNAT superfamily N-acetyltransferase